MQATVTGVRPFGSFDSIIRFDAVVEDTGHAVLIAVDHRPAADLLEALGEQGEVDVEVEAWQILGRVV